MAPDAVMRAQHALPQGDDRYESVDMIQGTIAR